MKMVVKGIGYEDVDWIQLAQDKIQSRSLLNTIMHIRGPENGECS